MCIVPTVGGGRKGGLKTAKPHRKTYKNRNTAQKNLQKPQYRTEKLTKTAIPHRKTYKNRNTASNFTKIPKLQLQMEKLSSHQYLRSIIPLQM